MAPMDQGLVAAQLSKLCAAISALRTKLEDHVKHEEDISVLARKKLDDFIDEVRRTHGKISDELVILTQSVGKVHRRIDRLVLVMFGSIVMVLLTIVGWLARELLSKG